MPQDNRWKADSPHENNPTAETYVVQRYIENPLLLGGRKFDIRQYVLLTPDLRCYMYRDSYVRTSATPYGQR